MHDAKMFQVNAHIYYKMYILKNISTFILILSSFTINLTGQVILPSVFSDNMVLQQNSEVAIWGWAGAGTIVKIVAGWNSKDTINVKADNYSAWKTVLKTTAAGGPYAIDIIGRSTIHLNNVMLGEVWLCSGQSNMAWTAENGITNKEEELAKANYPNIRIFHVYEVGAECPQHDCFGTWKECTSESMSSTSAVAYFFARELNQKLDVPVGIIVSAWGGTPIQVWIKEDLVENNPILSNNKDSYLTEWWPIESGSLYNSMIAPIAPYGIAGTLWYQGEANVSTYQVYSLMQKTLIENWRSDFKKEFPFYFVQIAPFAYDSNINAAFLREQQELTTKIVPNTGMIVISDLVDDVTNIHPRNKLDVGKRLANYALSETYHQDVGAYKSPMYHSMKVEKNKIRIYFDNVLTGLKCSRKSPAGFMIAGADKKFVHASAKIDGSTILIYSNKLKNPVAVRYCFDNTSMPDIFSTEGLPLAPFRTDTW